MAALAPLAVVIPARREACHLPALLADLARAPETLLAETVLVDGGSDDGTAAVARRGGARVITSRANRGRQLQLGIAATTAPWLLLLHADARLPAAWAAAVAAVLEQAPEPQASAWCFDLAIAGGGLPLRLLELAVAARTRLRQLPYGDQGLLLPRQLLAACGGMAPLPLMEDLELILRLRRLARIRSLGLPLVVNGRRWQRHGVLGTAWRNACLRRQWRQGHSAESLARRYYAPG